MADFGCREERRSTGCRGGKGGLKMENGFTASLSGYWRRTAVIIYYL
jgi:hypothetical protein